MPRVVENQRAKFETDSVLRQLQEDSEVSDNFRFARRTVALWYVIFRAQIHARSAIIRHKLALRSIVGFYLLIRSTRQLN